jgi:hypothetical protein
MIIGEQNAVGKETLKFGSIFGSLPDFPSLRPSSQEREKSSRGVCNRSTGFQFDFMKSNRNFSANFVLLCHLLKCLCIVMAAILDEGWGCQI